MVRVTVLRDTVSGQNSRLNGKITGVFAIFVRIGLSDAL